MPFVALTTTALGGTAAAASVKTCRTPWDGTATTRKSAASSACGMELVGSTASCSGTSGRYSVFARVDAIRATSFGSRPHTRT